MNILDNINSPSDLKKVKPEELAELAGEIRALIINTVSATGGHLSAREKGSVNVSCNFKQFIPHGAKFRTAFYSVVRRLSGTALIAP